MSKLIDGQAMAEKIKDKITKEIACSASDPKDLTSCQRPNLAIILVGAREDSKLYVSMKEKEAKKVGIDTHLYKCEENITEAELLNIIDFLNRDDLIDAILIQLPLPKHLNTDNIIRALNPDKDVDRFHPDNQNYFANKDSRSKLLPPLFMVVEAMLKEINFNLHDKSACIIANSDLFGKNLASFIEHQGGKATTLKASDHNLYHNTSQADLLISVVGKKHFIKKDMIKKDAVIIDVGITKEGEHVYGDVDFEDVKDKCSYITPVPGGVGPLTIAMTFANVLTMYKKNNKR